jgi:hypothetical protein
VTAISAHADTCQQVTDPADFSAFLRFDDAVGMGYPEAPRRTSHVDDQSGLIFSPVRPAFVSLLFLTKDLPCFVLIANAVLR